MRKEDSIRGAENTPFPHLDTEIYRLEGRIGEGGGGIVYKAWHTRLRKYVVLKELRRSDSLSVTAQRNEVEALKYVKSPYLPQVFDLIDDGEAVYTVMEWIEGESLDRILSRGQTVPQQAVIKWYGQIVSALSELHRRHIYHRDIKPANIMLTPTGDVCLIDFNTSLVSKNAVGFVNRSLGYASPEQYAIYEKYRAAVQEKRSAAGGTQNTSGDVTLGSDTFAVYKAMIETVDWARSDFYSLGATMYHLLSGVRPANHAAEVKPLAELGSFSEGLLYVIGTSMHLDPAARFSSADQLGAAISGIYRYDRRWKSANAQRTIAWIVLSALFLVFAALTVWGRKELAQEREANYYKAVYCIASAEDPREAYASALGVYDNRLEAHSAYAERLLRDGRLSECIRFIEENLAMFVGEGASDSAKVGGFYFILANAYYLENDYRKSAGNLKIALEYDPRNPMFLSDYAITLARLGDVEEAEKIAETVRGFGGSGDKENLLYGELSFARGDDENAERYLSEVIAKTDDAYLKYRAYRTMDDGYKRKGEYEASVDLLVKAKEVVSAHHRREILDRLADAYVKLGRYDDAIAAFEALAGLGLPTYETLQNLAILLQAEKRFDDAESVLVKLGSFYPEDYRVPMRLAFLEAERQAEKENSARDYADTLRYYQEAKVKYENRMSGSAKSGSGGGSQQDDPEMEQLEQVMEQLRSGRWLP